MKDYCTTSIDKFPHQKIVVSVPAALEFAARSLLRYFEEEVSHGTTFRADETVQIGWMLVMLKSGTQGNLEVWEPDFKTLPVTWIRGATTTCRHLTVQNEVCRQLGTEPNFPSLRDSAMTSPGLSGSHGFVMFRQAVDGPSSGWNFTDEGQTDVAADVCSLFQIALKAPIIVPYLALPSGTSVIHSGSSLSITLEGRTISSESNGFLERLLEEW